MDFKEQYPDSVELAQAELDKMDILLKNIEVWRESRFPEQIYSFNRHFDGDAKTSLIIRALEKEGIVGLPEAEIINSMFAIIENTAIMVFHMIANEDIIL